MTTANTKRPGEHENNELVELYEEKHYQGANPKDARCLFIGSDANFEPNIEKDPEFFNHVKEYLRNGVDFWRDNKVHHPFLLPDFMSPNGKRRKGQYYHERFQEIGFEPCHADQVSFLELLHYPTQVGKSPFGLEDLCSNHLACLRKAITSKGKIVFIAYSVAGCMEKTGEFSFLFEEDPVPMRGSRIQSLPTEYENEIYKIPHFSRSPKRGLTPMDMGKIADFAGI